MTAIRKQGDLPKAVTEHQRRMKAMEECGDLNRVSRLLAMSYETFSIANYYAEAANEIMERHGMVHKKVKTKANNLMQSFDAYDKEMSSMLGTKESREQLCGDFDLLQEMLNAFMQHDIEVKRGPYLSATLFLPEKK